jgi:hypothetical protein
LPFQIPDYRNAVIVAKNPLAARRATSYAERLRLGIAVIHGEAKVTLGGLRPILNFAPRGELSPQG